MGVANVFYFLVLLFVLLPFSQSKPTINVEKYLQSSGFLNSTKPTEEDVENALKKFQKVNSLQVTGTMNDETTIRMQSRRCGKPDNVFSSKYQNNDLYANWRKSHLTYKIYNWSEPFTKSTLRTVFEDSIKSWTQNVSLKIVESDSDKADILIHFTKLDGMGDKLGYAFFPEFGDIYLDKDEDWTLEESLANSSTNFKWVATHELGHALGLHHEENNNSIMFPYYSSKVFEPAPMDVEKLKSLYGPAELNNTILCSGISIDAILDTREPMLIVGDQYWTFADGGLQSGPFNISAQYPNLPNKIDAAFMVRKTSYFLSGNAYYRFKHTWKITTPGRSISGGFDNLPSDIDAAFYADASKRIYFFKGSKYYALDIQIKRENRLVVDGNDIEADWQGVPNNIDAVTTLGNSKALFIKKTKCYLVDLTLKTVVDTKDCSDYYKCQ